MGIGNVQGSYTVFPAAFPEPAGTHETQCTQAQLATITLKNYRRQTRRVTHVIKAQAQPASYTLTSQLLLTTIFTQPLTSEYYSSHTTNITDCYYSHTTDDYYYSHNDNQQVLL